MALVYKTINLWAFRDNNVHILCFAGENLGKEIRFKLINADGSAIKLDGSTQINLYWSPDGTNSSYYIKGSIIEGNNGIVAIPVTKELCSTEGRVKCNLEINNNGKTTRFGSINIDIVDSIGNVDISLLNPAQYDLIMTVYRDVQLLKDKINGLASAGDPNVEIVEAKGVSPTLKSKIGNYDTFAMFPNQATNSIKNSKNFISTDNWESVNTGTLTATGYSLKAVSEDNFGIYGSLEKDLSINYNKNIMVKARVRCISGDSCAVSPCWRKNINGVLVAPEYIAAGNMDISTANNSISWNLPAGKRWRDIWFIAFDGGSGTTINQIGLFVTSGTTVEISHFECYYSQDSSLTNEEIKNLQSDVSQNKNDVSNLKSTVYGTSGSAGLETRMGNAEDSITALQETVDGTETVAGLKQRMPSVEAHVSTLEETVNGAETLSGTMKNQIATAKTEVVEESVNPLAERVTAAEKKVTANETNISELKSDLDNILLVSKNLLNPFIPSDHVGKFVNYKTGEVSSNESYCYTDFCSIPNGAETLYFMNDASSNVTSAFITFYKSDKSFISGATSSLQSATIPSGAVYFVWSCFPSRIDGTQQKTMVSIDSTCVFGGGGAFEEYKGKRINPNAESRDRIIIVSKDRGQYAKISDAVSHANDGDTIIVYPGIYDDEIIEAWGKEVNIIGVSRVNCVIKNHEATYSKPPIEIGRGTLENLTIIAEYGNGTSKDSNGWFPYAVHTEDNNLFNGTLNINNCTLISELNASFGIGTRGGCEVNLKSSDFIGRNGSGNRALFFHDSASETYAGEQTLNIDDCKLISDSANQTTLRINDQNVNGSTVNIRFTRCLVYNKANSSARLGTSVTGGATGTGWRNMVNIHKSGMSFGNNMDELN